MNNNYFKNFLVLVIAFFTSIGFAQSSLTSSEYGTAIQSYLDQEKESLNLVTADISDLYVNKQFFSTKSKITHVYVNQRYQGVNIFNAISSVAIKDNVVFYYANNFIGNISQRVNATAPQLSAIQAIQRAANALNLGSAQDLNLLQTNEKKYIYSNGNISRVDIPVELVYYNIEGELKLAWDVSIYALDGKTWPSVRIDALNGEVLSQNDWILSCNFGDANHISHNHVVTKSNQNNDFNLFKDNYRRVDGSQYNVYVLPSGGPNDGDRSLAIEPALSDASPFGWHDTDGVSGAEYTITRGNNVWAMEDTDGNNNVGYSPDGTASLIFDFPFNRNQPPLGYQDASLTNLFYANNMMHDIWYQYGFDEASGNFQSNNYGNGGVGGDFVFADGQDGAGLNNATFGTPPDGNNPGMTMFLWAASGPAGDPLTINNGSLSGDYFGLQSNFGGTLTSTPITADLALVVDNNLGQPASTDPQDGCNTITNGADLNGKIVVIRRGQCEFGAKILAAENAGAVAVIMVNNVAGAPIVMGGGAVGGSVTIPAIMVNNIDGEALIAALLNGDTINGSLLDAGPYQQDGSLDNLIVAHEYGHGISTRLTGGANTSNCLGSATQMGEGWSDWFALMITMKATDVGETPKGIATHSIGQPIDGIGIRPAAYSTDFNVNGFTYGDTNNTASISQPHGIGFIYATMLWDLTWAYINKYGFDEDFFNGTGGNNKVMQLVIDGLKLQPCNPGFVDGRDALLAADNALTGGEDQCLIWEVFAARGLGLNADQGSNSSRTDQVEDFTMPPDTDPTLANCTSLSVDEFNRNDYKVFPNPTNGNVYIRTNRSLGEVTITLTDLNGRQVYSTQSELNSQVEIDMSQLQSGIYILNINGQNINSNNKIIKN